MTNIIWRTLLPCAQEKAFTALDTAEGRESFWAEKAPERDGVITFSFPNGVVAECAVLRRDPPALFEIDYFGSPTRFTLEAAGKDETVLAVEARSVPAGDHLEVYAGWVSVLMALKCQLATGYDLRNHDGERSWDQKFVEN